MANLILTAPLAGWCLRLDETPDPVFAEGMAGDGVAIDPTSPVLYAPCDGDVILHDQLNHTVTLRSAAGIDVLMHVGIDTVKVEGAGFEFLVRTGRRVTAGQPLLRFDLDVVARHATSPISPILVVSDGVKVLRRVARRSLSVGDFLMEVGVSESGDDSTMGGIPTEQPLEIVREKFLVPFAHGLHARPASSLAAALRPFSAKVHVSVRGRRANARSTTALMALGVRSGEAIEIVAQGNDAADATGALAALLQPFVASQAGVTRDSPAQSRAHRKRATEASPAADGAVLAGIVAHRGVVAGSAFQLSEPDLSVVEDADDEEGEALALHNALAGVRTHLEALSSASNGATLAVLAAHIELIQDPELEEQARLLMREGKSAGFAWREATREAIAALDALGEGRIAERAADLRDLENQVIRALSGRAPFAATLPEQAVVIGDEVLPSQLAALDHSRIAAICTAFGGPTSHAALLAASMDIPMIVALGPAVLSLANGTPLVVDALAGHLETGPDPQRWSSVSESARARSTQARMDRAAAALSCETTDGETVALHANLAALDEVSFAIEMGAEGCGLLRTEFLFLDRQDPPDEDEQALQYQELARALDDRPLTIRTLDVGGDKPIPYLTLPAEANPALGVRGLRARPYAPELLRTQFGAILRVEPHGQCRILLPMVTDLDDVRSVRALLDEMCRQRDIALPPALGIMIETPASALIADQLLREVDFVSIGTNDLSQYTLAMDRGNAALAPRLDALHPAVLRLIAAAAEAAQSAGKPVAVCGALGSDPDAVPILLGLGIREFSVLPAHIPRVKRLVRLLALSECRVLAWEALDQTSGAAVRALAAQWRGRHHQAKLLGA